MANRAREWWDDFFPAFRPAFEMIPRRVNNAQVRYLVKKLQLGPDKRFLDCPCGIGRIAIPLAKLGVRVTGVDITQSYLDELSARARRFKLPIDVIRRDMRRITFDSKFDAAANLWTSFGYFEKESDNLLVLKRAFRSLKPGGRFMVQLMNRDWIMANYSPRDWWDINDQRGRLLARVFEQRRFDYRTSINYGRWTFVKDGSESTHDVNIRMYSFHELVGIFEKVGFRDVEGFSSIKEEPISRDKRAMFVIGTRPKRR